MGANFLPKNVIVKRNDDGSKDTFEEYDYNTWGAMAGGEMLLLIAGYAIAAPFIVPLMFLITILRYRGGFPLMFWVITVLGGYVLLDVSKGWYLLKFMSIFFSETLVNQLISANAAVMGVSVMMILLGNQMMYVLRTKQSNNYLVLYISFIGFLLFIGYQIGMANVGSEGWLEIRANIVIPGRDFENNY